MMTTLSWIYRLLLAAAFLIPLIVPRRERLTTMRPLIAENMFQRKVNQTIVTANCRGAAINCTRHWEYVPLIEVVGLCEEYFAIECLAELAVSSLCVNDPGYVKLMLSLADDIADCITSGTKWTVVFLKEMIRKAIDHYFCHKVQDICYNVTQWHPANGSCDLNFPACIMDTYSDDLCRRFDGDLEISYYVCLSGALQCENADEVIAECETEYMGAIKRFISEIDELRENADDEKDESSDEPPADSNTEPDDNAATQPVDNSTIAAPAATA